MPLGAGPERADGRRRGWPWTSRSCTPPPGTKSKGCLVCRLLCRLSNNSLQVSSLEFSVLGIEIRFCVLLAFQISRRSVHRIENTSLRCCSVLRMAHLAHSAEVHGDGKENSGKDAAQAHASVQQRQRRQRWQRGIRCFGAWCWVSEFVVSVHCSLVRRQTEGSARRMRRIRTRRTRRTRRSPS